MNYPTAADLRAAAAEAILKRCDDPLLREIMASAASSAAEGKMSCRIMFPDGGIDMRRIDRLSDALHVLQLGVAWTPGENEVSLRLAWE